MPSTPSLHKWLNALTNARSLARRLSHLGVVGVFGIISSIDTSQAQAHSSSAAASPVASAVAFAITSQKGSLEIQCTATAIHLDGKCGLFTNRHCLIDDVEQVTLKTVQTSSIAHSERSREDFDLWRHWIASESEFGFQSTVVGVLKRSQRYDLAELDMPTFLRHRLCESRRLTPQRSKQSLPYLNEFGNKTTAASLGFVNKNLHVEYTGNDPWWTSWTRASMALPHAMSLRPNDSLILLRDLDIFPGMSGGFSVESETLDVIGINARYVPFQSIGLVLPLSSLADFRREPKVVDTNHDSQPSRPLGLTAINSRISLTSDLAGANQFKKSRGNTHADPGGNTHADPGSGMKQTMSLALSMMNEPDEGVPMPEAPETILLGVGDQQIDGFDDYLKKFESISPVDKQLAVTRGKAGYPSLAIRQGLFERLKGHYAANDLETSARRSILESSPNSPLGWERQSTGSLDMQIEINTKRKELTLVSSEHQLSSSALSQETKVFPGKIVRYSYSTDTDAKLITLKEESSTDSAKTMTCQNRHFLKLICSNSSSIFSLSLDQANTGKLSYRFGQIILFADQPFVDYQFGDLKPQLPGQ